MPGFSSTYSPLFLALFLIISAAVSYFFYRKSLLQNPKKYFLIALKSLAVFLLLALFIEPVLSSLVSRSNDRLDIILIDNSRSNLLNSKSDEIKKIIDENKILSGDYKVFTFSNTTSVLNSADSFGADGYETDLASSLKTIRNSFPDRQFNSVTVISDGIFNSGGNPLYEAKTFQSPFITLSIGDTVQQKDITVNSVLYNDKAFTNIPTSIKAFINIHHFTTGSVNINLLREGSVISTKSININSSGQNYEAEFNITENNPGKVKYRIESENKEGELTYRNNYTDFFITFIDNKINILAVSGGPGYDDAVITSVLKRIKNYNITFRTAKSPTDFYEGGIDYKSFPELSAVFMLNFPTGITVQNIVSDIANHVKSFSVPVIFFAGKNSDYRKLLSAPGFDEIIPFNIGRPNQGESLFSLQIVSSQENPMTRVSEINSTTQIFKNISGIQPKPGSVTLLTDKSSGEPVMMTRTSGNYKSTAFLGYGLWRWRLNLTSDAGKTLEKFLMETINLTLQKEKKTKFRVYPAKDIFDYSDQVKIIAEVSDENYMPTRNAKVTGKILKEDGSKAADLNFTAEENKYIAYSAPLPYGDYNIEAESELNSVYYAKDNSRFSVDTLNTEYLNTRTNQAALRELALNTRGTYISNENYNTVSSVISQTNNSQAADLSISRKSRFNLWENKYMLGLIIMLFSIEWVVRKRNNIP